MFAQGLPAQQPLSLPLGTPDWTANLEFTNLVGIVEVEDGVIVGDRAEARVTFIPWSGTSQLVGREGQGPGEYQGVFSLLRVGTQGGVLLDGQGEWSFIDGSARSIAAIQPPSGVRSVIRGPPAGADSEGRVLLTGGRGDTGTMPVVLMSFTPPRLDTLDDALSGWEQIEVMGGRGMVTGHPLATTDAPLLLQDGWVAIARGSPYRVDWISPTGERRTGPALPTGDNEVTRELQCDAIARTFGSDMACDPGIFDSWPDNAPPFEGLHVARHVVFEGPGGSVLVRRLSPVQSSTAYDLVDRSGVLTATLSVAPSETIVGTGARGLYVARIDEFDLQHLVRYPWPSELLDLDWP